LFNRNMANSSRSEVLSRLRAAYPDGRKPFAESASQAANKALPVTQLAGDEDLLARFKAEVERVKGEVYVVNSDNEALEQLGELLRAKTAGNPSAVMWDDLPIPGVPGLLRAMGMAHNANDNAGAAAAQVGITGAQAALATTGTLVLVNGPGRSRQASLLPPIHIAIVRRGQLLPRLEDWVAQQRTAGSDVWREHSNITLITGRSRTADIEMIPVFGVHGPLELHVIVI
jgi:L-lactate dehydrogenase complex protein LldG